MSLIKGYRMDVRTITVTDQTFWDLFGPQMDKLPENQGNLAPSLKNIRLVDYLGC
jgi:hypothetical protein